MSRRGVKLPKGPPSSIFLAFESWPANDQTLWQKARRKGDLLVEGGRAASWRPGTIAKNKLDYSRWLGWIARAHPEELALSPMARITLDRVKAYEEDLHRSLAPQSVSAHLLGLGFMMNALSDTSDFSWITCAAQRLERRAIPVRNNRSRLRSPHEFVELGFRLMQEAENGKHEGRFPPAVRYRNGLIIALLAYRPIRLSNLAGIHIGQQLRKCGDSFELHYTADETKQHRPMELHLPPSLTVPLTRYMAVHRPVLLACKPFNGTAGQTLWVAADGGPFRKGGIQRVIMLQTGAAFGETTSVHLFRSCAATMIAIDDPAHAQDIAAILGHSTMATSERHYNQAQTIDAGRQYHIALRSRRLNLRSKRGTGTTPC